MLLRVYPQPLPFCIALLCYLTHWHYLTLWWLRTILTAMLEECFVTRIPPACFPYPYHCSGASKKPNVRTLALLNSVSGRAPFRHLRQNPGNADDIAPRGAKPPGWENVAIFVFGLNCAIGGKCNQLASVLRQTIGRRSCFFICLCLMNPSGAGL